MKPPMIWEGKKGQPATPAMPLLPKTVDFIKREAAAKKPFLHVGEVPGRMPNDLNVRPVVDEKYIIPKTVDFIKREAAAKKPFFVYVGYSELHPPVIGEPGLCGQVGPARRGIFRPDW